MRLKRRIEWVPAYDKRPKKAGDPNYGIHGLEMRWLLSGPNGVAQFVVYTNWMLPSARTPWNQETTAHLLQPIAADLGYHARKRQYSGQSSREKCQYLAGDTCYYDGSGLNAEPVLEALIAEGEEAVWKLLEVEYQQIKGGK